MPWPSSAAIGGTWGRSGAIFLIYELFFRMMSHPGVIVRVGNPGREQVRPSHSAGLFTNHEHLKASRTGSWIEQPNDPTRTAHASLMAVQVVDFIVHHEIAHIRHGHCEYLNSRLGIPFIAEAVATGGPHADLFLMRQALEVDADTFAAVNGVKAAVGMRMRFSGDAYPDLHGSNPRDPTLGHRLLGQRHLDFVQCLLRGGTVRRPTFGLDFPPPSRPTDELHGAHDS